LSQSLADKPNRRKRINNTLTTDTENGGHFEKWNLITITQPHIARFDKVRCVDGLWDSGGSIVIKAGIASRNEPSAAVIFNFVFREYLNRGSKYLHQIWYIGRQWNFGGRGMVQIYFA